MESKYVLMDILSVSVEREESVAGKVGMVL
jgi:hypothetical protein